MSIDSPTLGRLQGWPPFVRELDATLSVHSQYVLSGNLYDSFLTQPAEGGAPTRLLPLRAPCCGRRCAPAARRSWPSTTRWTGCRSSPATTTRRGRAERLLGKIKAEEKPSLEALTRLLAAVARPKEDVRAAFVIDSASRIARTPTDLEPAERDFFRFCAKLSRTARRSG